MSNVKKVTIPKIFIFSKGQVLFLRVRAYCLHFYPDWRLDHIKENEMVLVKRKKKSN
ncbi:MAG: hypothetical protein ACE3JQ_02470 [Paenisporosarcina sp.]